MNKFKIGDIVEGSQDSKWVRGVIVEIYPEGSLAIDVLETESEDCLHHCSGHLKTRTGWFLHERLATLSKNYIISKILDEL